MTWQLFVAPNPILALVWPNHPRGDDPWEITRVIFWEKFGLLGREGCIVFLGGGRGSEKLVVLFAPINFWHWFLVLLGLISFFSCLLTINHVFISTLFFPILPIHSNPSPPPPFWVEKGYFNFSCVQPIIVSHVILTWHCFIRPPVPNEKNV